MTGNGRSVIIRGARVHNLKNIDLDIPLGKMVAVAGVSGSGKSSLALGILYSEGSRRYLESLSAYTRRRLTQAAEADVDLIDNVPAAIALHQRPTVPGIRSTFGTMTELLNSLRLMYSRLGSHRCPNGHMVPPSADVAAGRPLTCPECGAVFEGPSAESFSFNSSGACPRCSGTGIVRDVDDSLIVPDESKTIDEGAVEPWNMFGISWMHRVAKELGVRTDVPFSELTEDERRVVFEGPEVERYIIIPSKNGKMFDLNCKYRNARAAVTEALNHASSEKGVARVERYMTTCTCPECGGTRLNARASSSVLCGLTLPQSSSLTLSVLERWVRDVPGSSPEELRPMASSICTQFANNAVRLLDLGLGYLSLDRDGSTLSTGERQRVQLARSVRSRTTGAMYVLDEPSIGLHPSNVDGLIGVMGDLVDHGNTVVLVDHDVRVLRTADWLIEMGPGAGEAGGTVIAQGTVDEVSSSEDSRLAPFLDGSEDPVVRERAGREELFSEGFIRMVTDGIHTVRPLDVRIPRGRLTVVTGVSGSGKTTMVLESLVPALESMISGGRPPEHVRSVEADGVGRVNLIDATPVGANVRSTVSTYSGVLDVLRRSFASSPAAKAAGLRAADFSYNTGSLRCPECDGTGTVTMDVQFLPDVEVPCPACGGCRYSDAAWGVKRMCRGSDEGLSLPEVMNMTVDSAMEALSDIPRARDMLGTLSDLGLGYLTLGESTPALSGGEAQRLKLAAEMGRGQEDAVFVFDEPTIGLHPLDVRVLVGVFDRLLERGATVIVIDHDLDMIANADYIIDMGPGGGSEGGQIVAAGTPEEVASDPKSVTGRYLREVLAGHGSCRGM